MGAWRGNGPRPKAARAHSQPRLQRAAPRRAGGAPGEGRLQPTHDPQQAGPGPRLQMPFTDGTEVLGRGQDWGGSRSLVRAHAWLGSPRWREGSSARSGPPGTKLLTTPPACPREGTGRPADPWAGSQWPSRCSAGPAAVSSLSPGAGGPVPAPVGAALVRESGLGSRARAGQASHQLLLKFQDQVHDLHLGLALHPGLDVLP